MPEWLMETNIGALMDRTEFSIMLYKLQGLSDILALSIQISLISMARGVHKLGLLC